MDGPHWKLEDDLQTITITFPTNPVVGLRYGVSAVEDLLKNLGMMRAAMKPEVAKDHSVGQRVEAIPNPRWFTQPEIMVGDSLLHIRDPRYGWLHYLIPRDEARKLAGYLQTQADSPPPGPPQGRPS